MSGLARLAKQYGRIKINGRVWVWDYANDRAVPDDEMTPAMRRASDKAWAEAAHHQLGIQKEKIHD